MAEFAGNLSQSVSKVGPTRLYLNIGVTAPDLEMDREDFTNAFGPGGAHPH